MEEEAAQEVQSLLLVVMVEALAHGQEMQLNKCCLGLGEAEALGHELVEEVGRCQKVHDCQQRVVRLRICGMGLRLPTVSCLVAEVVAVQDSTVTVKWLYSWLVLEVADSQVCQHLQKEEAL